MRGVGPTIYKRGAGQFPNGGRQFEFDNGPDNLHLRGGEFSGGQSENERRMCAKEEMQSL
jgi:hypothetical protein